MAKSASAGIGLRSGAKSIVQGGVPQFMVNCWYSVKGAPAAISRCKATGESATLKPRAMTLERMTEGAANYFRGLQHRLCLALEEVEQRQGGGRFREDAWQHASGGGGITRVLAAGAVFEKAGVNFSRVRGTFSPEIAAATPGAGAEFSATGISLVLHPRNPRAPTVHANFRFLTKGSGAGETGWFGGGADLTPYYFRREDVIHFHRAWRAVCQRHPVADYARFKRWCDEYFHLPHRGEARGVGGIFFDYLKDRLEETFEFVRDAGDQFLPAYLPILERRMGEAYGERERRWQLARRGRYVEFNLLYDRGTTFGLKTAGRVESILMSLPPEVHWGYNEIPPAGSPEAELLAALEPRDWAGEP
ncbi:MAG TPA: oxygen-dependent coproporphyrinogen oxidase [Candidatus Acidoferrales bacterium]|nr:oxygen-dependent coproporphyrinogen oxidase [Candidatus Acidoferrales bacterium]